MQEAHDLQLHVVLIRPEPRALGVRGRRSRAASRPRPLPDGSRSAPTRAAPNARRAGCGWFVQSPQRACRRSDVRACSSTTIPFAHSRPALPRELDVRHDADADDHGVALEAPAVRRLDRVDARRAVQLADRGAAADLDAGSRVAQLGRMPKPRDSRPAPSTRSAASSTVTAEPALARDGRHLEADVAASDHHDRARPAAATR